jgi:hypothetical protein
MVPIGQLLAADASTRSTVAFARHRSHPWNTPVRAINDASRDSIDLDGLRRDAVVMTMYLPNPDLRPIGSEPAEFIDAPTTADDVANEARAPTKLATDDHRGDVLEGEGGTAGTT